MTQPIVLLHGWGLSSAVWVPLQAQLDPQLTVLAPDLPGHGKAASAGNTLESWAEALLAHIPDGSILVGWSLGAQLAMHIAVHAPQKVARLVLIAASPRFVQADNWPAALPAATLEEFRSHFELDPATTQRRFVALQSLGDAARKHVAARLGEALTPADTTHLPALATGLRLLAETDQRTLVRHITQPVRLLHGSEDKLMPVAAAEWLADALPLGRMSVLEHTGHAPFISRPTECATLIESFAREVFQ